MSEKQPITLEDLRVLHREATEASQAVTDGFGSMLWYIRKQEFERGAVQRAIEELDEPQLNDTCDRCGIMAQTPEVQRPARAHLSDEFG